LEALNQLVNGGAFLQFNALKQFGHAAGMGA
jgi:hypothetical protein